MAGSFNVESYLQSIKNRKHCYRHHAATRSEYDVCLLCLLSTVIGCSESTVPSSLQKHIMERATTELARDAETVSTKLHPESVMKQEDLIDTKEDGANEAERQTDGHKEDAGEEAERTEQDTVKLTIYGCVCYSTFFVLGESYCSISR
jgi:hypothetical protein